MSQTQEAKWHSLWHFWLTFVSVGDCPLQITMQVAAGWPKQGRHAHALRYVLCIRVHSWWSSVRSHELKLKTKNLQQWVPSYRIKLIHIIIPYHSIILTHVSAILVSCSYMLLSFVHFFLVILFSFLSFLLGSSLGCQDCEYASATSRPTSWSQARHWVMRRWLVDCVGLAWVVGWLPVVGSCFFVDSYWLLNVVKCCCEPMGSSLNHY